LTVEDSGSAYTYLDQATEALTQAGFDASSVIASRRRLSGEGSRLRALAGGCSGNGNENPYGYPYDYTYDYDWSYPDCSGAAEIAELQVTVADQANQIAELQATNARLQETNANHGTITNHGAINTCDLSGPHVFGRLDPLLDLTLDPTIVRLDLSFTNLAGAKLDKANLRGATFEGANLVGASLVGLNEGLSGTINLAKTIFKNADLSGADFTGSNMRGAVLAGANMTGAILVNVDLTCFVAEAVRDAGSFGYSFQEYLRDRTHCGNLRNAILIGANLTGANLVGALIGGADFTGAIGANFTGAVDHYGLPPPSPPPPLPQSPPLPPLPLPPPPSHCYYQIGQGFCRLEDGTSPIVVGYPGADEWGCHTESGNSFQDCANYAMSINATCFALAPNGADRNSCGDPWIDPFTKATVFMARCRFSDVYTFEQSSRWKAQSEFGSYNSAYTTYVKTNCSPPPPPPS